MLDIIVDFNSMRIVDFVLNTYRISRISIARVCLYIQVEIYRVKSTLVINHLFIIGSLLPV